MRFGIPGEVPFDAPDILSPWPLGSMLLSSKVLVQGPEVHFDPTGRVSSAMQRPRKARLLHVACDTHGFVPSSQCFAPLRARSLGKSKDSHESRLASTLFLPHLMTKNGE